LKYIQNSEIPASVTARIEIPSHARVLLVENDDVLFFEQLALADVIVANDGRVIKNRFGQADAAGVSL
jgi:hypothetical protein